MKVHYKIALFAAIVFFAVVGGYLLTRDAPKRTSDTDSATASTTVNKPSSTNSSARPGNIRPKPLADANDAIAKNFNATVAKHMELAGLNQSSTNHTSTTKLTAKPNGTNNTLPLNSSPKTTIPPKPATMTFNGTPVDDVLIPKPITGTASIVTPSNTVTPPNFSTPTTASKPTPQPTPSVARRTSYPTSYTIQSGDTLSSIALTLYGSDRYWVEIAQTNPTIDPLKLKPGQTIKLPLPADMQKTGTQRAVRSANGKGTQYTVRAGDNLSTIAQEFYNNSGLWRRIYNANKAAIGSNPDTLQAGVTLDIPPVESGSGN